MYTVKKLADMSGVSRRTLHYYDQIGLLRPGNYAENGYREYGDAEALRLQQILFFRELGLPLSRIGEILDNPDFDLLGALNMHKSLLEEKIGRLFELSETVDATIRKIEGEKEMKSDDLYKGFDKKRQEAYEQEIAEKYGTAALDESRRRTRGFSRQDWDRVQAELRSIHEAIAASMDKGFDSQEVQEQIARHRQWLNHFYDCGDEMHLGLGQLYRTHPGFIKNYRGFLGSEDGAEFMYQAIRFYCERGGKR